MSEDNSPTGSLMTAYLSITSKYKYLWDEDYEILKLWM